MAEDRTREHKAKGNEEKKERGASGYHIKRIHISLSEESEHVVEKMREHRAYKRAACVKYQSEHRARKQICQDIDGIEVQKREEYR